VVEQKVEAKRRIQYKDKVRMTDGFYAGQNGEVMEMGIKTIREPYYWSSVGPSWRDATIQTYRVKLEDGNEVWIDAGEVEVIELSPYDYGRQ
jgi:hypothetical protein